MKILLTAFEPFGENSINASEEAMKLVRAPEGTELVRTVLPVTYARAGQMIEELILRENPDAVLCTGEAGGRVKITVERIAVNVCDSVHPDNAGVILEDTPVKEDGPAAYFATLPVKSIIKAMDAEGIPVSISDSAGTYLCNNVMYCALHACANSASPVPAGFIHVPAAPGEYLNRPELPRMPSGTAAAGIETALRVIAENTGK